MISKYRMIKRQDKIQFFNQSSFKVQILHIRYSYTEGLGNEYLTHDRYSYNIGV